MSTDPTPDEPAHTAEPAQDDEFVATLRRLIASGEKLTLQLETEPVPASMKAEPYERFTRSIRQSVLLARHIRDNPIAARATRRKLARSRIRRDVEDAIHQRAENPAQVEHLHRELRERMEQPDLDLDLEHRSIEHIIRDICRDLGLDNWPGLAPWPRRTPQDVADLAAFAAAPPVRDPDEPGPDEPDPNEPHFDEPGQAAPPGDTRSAVPGFVPDG